MFLSSNRVNIVFLFIFLFNKKKKAYTHIILPKLHMKFTNQIIVIFIVAFTTVSAVFGQVSSNKSRLNVGQNPKKSSFTPPSNSIFDKANAVKNLNVDSKSSINLFYRNLLINNTTSSNKSSSTSSSNSTIDNSDRLFKNEKISISNIYPNPANDYAYIDYKILGDFEAGNVSFFNLLGKQIAEYEIGRTTERLKVNTSSWESGIYMYQLVIDGKKIATKKLLVRHN